MNKSDLEKLYEDGYRVLSAVMTDGSKRSLRLFKSGDSLCYMAKGRRRYGYHIEYILQSIASVGVPTKPVLSVLDRYLSKMAKFQKAFTQNAHPNLWANLREGYSKLDLDTLKAYITSRLSEAELTDYWEISREVREYCQANDIEYMSENSWKTTTIKSHKPRGYMGGQYYQCVENIKGHLDRKEKFSYYWESGYDVSVSGNVGNDGVYRAWLSLEYRGCGNGHYYLLINENQAVFSEDD